MPLTTFFSNRIEILFQTISQNLFAQPHPFTRRLIVVPSLAMKSWLAMSLADKYGVAIGIEIELLNQAVQSLTTKKKKIPSRLEIALAIEAEIKEIAESFHLLSAQEKIAWQPVLDYIKTDDPFNRVNTKRIHSFCDHIASLFVQYHVYGQRMLKQWEIEGIESPTSSMEWQKLLWFRLYQNYPWATFGELLSANIDCNIYKQTEIHLFGFSHLSTLHYRFFNQCAQYCPVSYYQLSPCQLFWTDIESEGEQKRRRRRRKRNTATESQEELDAYLKDNNVLLANFGRIGREMARLIEETDQWTEENYLLPQSVKESGHYDALITNEMAFYPTDGPMKLLEAVQGDLSLLRNHRIREKINFHKFDESIQLHIAPSKMREVQILYHNLIHIIDAAQQDNNPICPRDIIVMAPDIMSYEPYIRSVFGSAESCLDFQIMDLATQTQNVAIKAFRQLIALAAGRWDAVSVMEVFSNRLFQYRHRLKMRDLDLLRKWISDVGIRWGENAQHRNDILKNDYCAEGMVDNGSIGTWEWGFDYLLNEFAEKESETTDGDEHSVQKELLDQFIYLFHSLRKDLLCLTDKSTKTMHEWISYLQSLFNTYYGIDPYNPSVSGDYQTMLALFGQLDSIENLKNHSFSYETIEYHLMALFNQNNGSYREHHLQAVRFCSMLPMRAIPAKVIALLGMDEEAFPRPQKKSSLNLLQGNDLSDYYPSSTDFDRYLFLETLLSTRNHLLLSYSTAIGATETAPSLLVTEFMNYLDQAYSIEGNPVTNSCIISHPFHAYDYRYFQAKDSGTPLHNYSMMDFRAAQAYYSLKKETPHTAIPVFYNKNAESDVFFNKISMDLENTSIDIQQLSMFARNPLKVYFNKKLNIYLEEYEKNELHTEERFVLSPLEKYKIKSEILKQPTEVGLEKAEKAGLLPLGSFKTVSSQNIEAEIKTLKSNMDAMGSSFEESFELELSSECTQAEEVSAQKWIVPALVIECEGKKVCITGKLPQVTPQGLVVQGKNEIGDIAKFWPQFLIFTLCVDALPIKIRKQLLPIKQDQPKAAFFDQPEDLLKKYIQYYSIALDHPSLLIPEWLSDVLEYEPKMFMQKIQEMMQSRVKRLYNPYAYCLFPRGTVPENEQLVMTWKQKAHDLYDGMRQNWF